ncbi:phosphate ABC transporter permease PstA [Alteromonas lipotrueiana]|uniref:phosphate ABC transporter permease PstA n=1 Tax=Alteromonas lipotrueiana TaxID=2803815 RepID=UPI001C44673D|nr:phosphate ABC transporter permease PstA [Alteromonas lipotrueiana]
MDKRWFYPWRNAAQRQTLVISLCAFFTAGLLLGLVGIILLIFARGGGYFWPEDIYEFGLPIDNKPEVRVFGEFQGSQGLASLGDKSARYWLVYSHSNPPYKRRALVAAHRVQNADIARHAARVLLHDGRTFLAKPVFLNKHDERGRVLDKLPAYQQQVQRLTDQIETIRDIHLGPLHRKISTLTLKDSQTNSGELLAGKRAFERWQSKVIQLEATRGQYTLTLEFADTNTITVPLNQLKQLVYPGQLNQVEKLWLTLGNIWQFLSQPPQQANTAGGIFPALFGTVLMVFLMTLIVTPFGVLAAVYLSEYAPRNAVTTAIRVAVANMAGVPSIVYGVFGLGFFIYGIGGQLDEWLFGDSLPAPTLGTPGLFWASLTMALLTLPVVIVATEEGLRNVPAEIKAGSYALGATKAETMWHTVLPMASPGIMTGVILAIARAAGEVAPLMLVGAVKFAPNLPVDSEFPFLHLERQFMHLGVLIYDGAFHSQTQTSGASMMFAACLLLLLVVFILNIIAVVLRNKLRKRYQKET